MSTIMPEGRNLSQAVVWIKEELEEGKNLSSLLQEVGMRFNLSPNQDRYVLKLFCEDQDGSESKQENND